MSKLLLKIRNLIIIYYKYFIFLIIAFFYLYKLGSIPLGIFCDEAEIGNRAYDLLLGNYKNLLSVFHHRLENFILGNLPIYATFPFVLMLGLNDFSLRLGSCFYALLIFIILYIILKSLKQKYIMFPILLLAFSPGFYHISRINWGHLPSLFLVSLSYLCYIFYDFKSTNWYLILSGIFLGIASYGYAGFTIFVPLFCLALWSSEIIINRFNIKAYYKIFVVSLIVFLIYLPNINIRNTYPEVREHFKIKNGGKDFVLNVEKFREVIQNYPKYYSFDYLFIKGEEDVVTRPSIRGNGLLLPIFLVIFLLSCIRLFTDKNLDKKYFLPFFILVLFYPLPDAIFTKAGRSPSTFPISAFLITVPFLASYGLNIFNFFKETKWKYYMGTVFFAFLVLIFSYQAVNFIKNYQKYPLFSSDYWGWQYGMKEILINYKKIEDNYDELYLTNAYNAPLELFKYYNTQIGCRKCLFMGDPPDLLNFNKRQLFFMRSDNKDDWEKKIPQYNLQVKNILKLPNGKIEYYQIYIYKDIR